MKNYLKNILIVIMFFGYFTSIAIAAFPFFTVPQGGTGWGNLQANTVLLGNGTSKIGTTTQGINGQVLMLSGGVPVWYATSTSGADTNDWSFTTNYGSQVLTASTTIPIWIKGALYASSTSIFQGLAAFGNATATQLTATDAWITRLQNLTSNGFIKTGSGNGTLSIDTSSYQASDATLTALAGLTVSAGSLITGTGADAFSILGAGTNGYVLGMSGSAPAWLATTTFSGGLTYSAGNVTADLGTSIDISSETNLTCGTNCTLTGDDISVDDAFLLNTGDTGTGTYDFSGATLKQKMYPAFTYATSTAWTGTTTIPLAPAYVAELWNGVKCFTDAGTLNVVFSDGTNLMNLLNASTTVGTFTLSTNNSFTASEKRYADIGTPASSPTKISCSIDKTINN